ncbi:nucleoside triphosphate pyrophosphohydrolase [Microbulbifer thermotolerans]|uniref:Nucleoside triphosphate pyrophosphohydrolase n=1 Tax=Microbulbifer thermotolerans TaxID=252514 RepID=A0AB35HV41_MICTH|nr:nucleoside triphosphate pyrophosphohydrolase [Microbulbifer thermotolerans]MCX2800809.1 nucleoside triphosphate pyrophosphohydrolase [Microbulbifer thermotolerans]MCX2841062.1 nucleoside triphosphate pyrophosphohydrolase [Microbulbifer thermotolerans]
MRREKYSIEDLLHLMARLRSPDGGCPWDRKQSFATIVPSTIEEAYEVAEAIEAEDYDHLHEELGDLLFQVIFYAQLGREAGHFDFSAIVDTLVRKLLRRHPHVFPSGELYGDNRGELYGDNRGGVTDEDGVKANWEAIKAAERGAKGESGTLDGVALGLPALTRAAKLQKRAANVGFDWHDISGVLDKIEEEIAELREAVESGDFESAREELGDLLFSCVNAARHLKVDPETALRQCNRKFETRFNAVETSLKKQGRRVADASLEELDQLWQRVKRAENQKA